VTKQTVTLRLDEDDLTYLSQVEISGAGNLSEKIRALINEARSQREGAEDYAAAHDFARHLFARVDRRINAAEVLAGKRSELTHRLLAWLPEAVAYALAAGPSDSSASEKSIDLAEIELGLAERTFSLVDSMVQLARAGFPGCLEPQKAGQRAHFAVKNTG